MNDHPMSGALDSGEATAVVDGVRTEVSVAPTPSGGVAVSGEGFSIEVAPSDASGNGNGTGDSNGTGTGDDVGDDPGSSPRVDDSDGDVSAGAQLLFTRGRAAEVRVSGFAPRSPVRLWLFSEPRLLGEFETSTAGALEAVTEAIPDDVTACLHTVHAQGVLPGGREVSLSIGVWVDADPYPFVDVGAAGVHRRAVACLEDEGLIRGVGDARFDPWGEATRGQLSSVFAGWFDLSAPRGFSSSHGDVSGSVHEPGMSALLHAGVMQGMGDGSFGVHQPMTRGQFARVLAGLLELETEGVEVVAFPDAGVAHGPAIEALSRVGLVSGLADGTFAPHEPITRAQAASMIVRAQIAMR